MGRFPWAGACLLCAAVLSAGCGTTGPDDDENTVFHSEDVPTSPGSEWTYFLRVFETDTLTGDFRLVETDVLRLRTLEVDTLICGPCDTVTWVASTSTWSDTLFTIRESDRLCVIVPSMGDTISIPFPLDARSSWTTGRHRMRAFDPSSSSRIGISVDFLGSPAVHRDLVLQRGAGPWELTLNDIVGGRRREITAWLENYTIAGAPPPTRGSY